MVTGRKSLTVSDSVHGIASLYFPDGNSGACMQPACGLYNCFLYLARWIRSSFSFQSFYLESLVLDFHQRKCNVIFDLSCNLARLLEFCTREIPQAFLSRPNTNLRRLTEIIVFSLYPCIFTNLYAEFFSLTFKKHSHTSERVNKGMLLAPLVGIVLNLLDASGHKSSEDKNGVVSVFASADC